MASSAGYGGGEAGEQAAPPSLLNEALPEQARRRLLLWTPVAFGLGAQLWFLAPVEPPLWPGLLAAGGALAMAALVSPASPSRFACLALLLAALGATAAGLRAWSVEGPRPAEPFTAAVEGRVRAVERAASGRPRLLLDDLFVYGLAPEATPRRARVTLGRAEEGAGLPVGARVAVLARLGPPGGPVEPGGYDFRRAAFFYGVGMTGIARGPLARLHEEERPPVGLARLGLALDAARRDLALALIAAMPGESGAFAAAIAVGDRSALPPEAQEALRVSSLAHLLAISGLHMAMATGLVFFTARLGLALAPGAALRLPVKSVAAALALAAGAAYLALSGGAVATQRAFLMATVAFAAVIVGRPAVTLRALAVAATLVLAAAPESLVEAGFQMSFAATLALVAAYEWARERGRLRPAPGFAAAVGRYALALLATSVIAGAATAPFAAHHFNRLATFGLIANLAAVPAMGLVVAPALSLAAVLAPLGLAEWPLRAAEAGIEWILAVARFVAGLEGASLAVGAAPAAALWLTVGGGLWLALGRGPLRLAGLAPLALAAPLVWSGEPRPALLVAREGALVGLMTPEGRALSRASGAGYAAETWLRRDGDGASQAEAAARPAFLAAGDWRDAAAGLARVHLYDGRRRQPPGLAARCGERAVVVAPRASLAAAGPCLILDRRALSSGGARAVDWIEGRPAALAAAGGRRAWSRAGF